MIIKKYMLLLLLTLILVSCSNEIPNESSDENLFGGKYQIEEVYHTNGPVCYDLQVNDEIELRHINNKQVIMEYRLFENNLKDTFEIQEITDSNLLSQRKVENSSAFLEDKSIYQILKIKKFENYYIFNMQHRAIEDESISDLAGDVGHFKARKVK